MQGFQGYGYSKDFVKHMEMLTTFFNFNPNTKIQIVIETDEICSHCPYKTENNCGKDSESLFLMENLDRLVIKSAHLIENQIYTIEQIIKLVNSNLNQKSIREICDTCSWNDICLFYLKHTKHTKNKKNNFWYVSKKMNNFVICRYDEVKIFFWIST